MALLDYIRNYTSTRMKLREVIDVTESNKVQMDLNSERFNENEPTGFDLRLPDTQGVLELCGSASSGIVWRIDQNQVFSTLTGQTTFGDGETLLADRTFAHYPVDENNPIIMWNRGKKFTITETKTIELLELSLKNIITYDINGELKLGTSVEEAITEDTIVSVVTGNPTIAQKVVFANERHGKEMSNATHLMLHETTGARWGAGFDITGLVNNGNTFTLIKSGVIYDEDLHHTNPDINSAPFLYRDLNGDWALETVGIDVVSSNALSFNNGTAVDALYNRDNGDGSWDLVDTVNDYVIMHIFATNDAEFRVFKIVGQNLYTDRTTARNRLDGEVSLLKSGSLPTPEFLHLCSYILDGSGLIETGLDGEIYVDYRPGYPAPRY